MNPDEESVQIYMIKDFFLKRIWRSIVFHFFSMWYTISSNYNYYTVKYAWVRNCFWGLIAILILYYLYKYGFPFIKKRRRKGFFRKRYNYDSSDDDGSSSDESDDEEE